MTEDEPCPDCGYDPDDKTLHLGTCPRVMMEGHPLEYLQFGPPWQPWPDQAELDKVKAQGWGVNK